MTTYKKVETTRTFCLVEWMEEDELRNYSPNTIETFVLTDLYFSYFFLSNYSFSFPQQKIS